MSEQSLTNAELAILSLIAESPRHGYELEQVIEERGMREWTEVAFSSIYFILNGLVKKGLADSTLQPAAGRGPAKKVFAATPAGQIALHDAVLQAVTLTEHDHRRFLLGLSCLPLLTPSEVEEAFSQRIAFLFSKQEQFLQHPALTQPHFPPHVRAMFTFSAELIQAELAWSQHFLADYQKGIKQNGKTRPQKTV